MCQSIIWNKTKITTYVLSNYDIKKKLLLFQIIEKVTYNPFNPYFSFEGSSFQCLSKIQNKRKRDLWQERTLPTGEVGLRRLNQLKDTLKNKLNRKRKILKCDLIDPLKPSPCRTNRHDFFIAGIGFGFVTETLNKIKNPSRRK